MQMAAQSFTSALMHIGGQVSRSMGPMSLFVMLIRCKFHSQNVYYNAFTPPPYNLASSGYQWTTGSVYYPTIIMAELFGSSNQSRIVDLNADGGNEFHPAYAVYENGVPTRLGLINFVSDPSQANDLTVNIDFGGAALPQPTVQVR